MISWLVPALVVAVSTRTISPRVPQPATMAAPSRAPAAQRAEPAADRSFSVTVGPRRVIVTKGKIAGLPPEANPASGPKLTGLSVNVAGWAGPDPVPQVTLCRAGRRHRKRGAKDKDHARRGVAGRPGRHDAGRLQDRTCWLLAGAVREHAGRHPALMGVNPAGAATTGFDGLSRCSGSGRSRTVPSGAGRC